MLVRRVRAALRVMRPDQNFFHDALIALSRGCEPVIDTYWHNPELVGVWEIHYRLTCECFELLYAGHFIRLDGESQPEKLIFRTQQTPDTAVV